MVLAKQSPAQARGLALSEPYRFCSKTGTPIILGLLMGNERLLWQVTSNTAQGKPEGFAEHGKHAQGLVSCIAYIPASGFEGLRLFKKRLALDAVPVIGPGGIFCVLGTQTKIDLETGVDFGKLCATGRIGVARLHQGPALEISHTRQVNKATERLGHAGGLDRPRPITQD